MRATLASALLAAMTMATAAYASDSTPSEDLGAELKQDARAVGDAVKVTAKKIGVAGKDAAHKVADEAVKGAHAVSAGAKAGYAKARDGMHGEKSGAAPAK